MTGLAACGYRRRRALGMAVATATALLFVDVPSASGVSKNFTNGTANQLWGDDANWTPSGVPGAADDVTIPATPPYLSVNASGAVANTVNSSIWVTIDDFSGSGSTSLAVGSYTSTAGIAMRAGKFTANYLSAPYFDVGQYYSIGSTFELGAGGTATITNEMIVGRFTVGVTDFGTGTVLIGAGGGTLTTSALYLGAGTGGNGHMDQKGGVVNSTNPMYVGTELLSIGDYVLENGVFNGAGAYTGVYGGTGSVHQSGGTFNAPAAHFGAFVPGSVGTLNISGGTFNSPDYLFLGRIGAEGHVVQTGGLVKTGDVYLASDGSGTATYNLQAGTLQASGVFFGTAGSPVGTFNWSGGTLVNKPGADLSFNSYTSVLEIKMTGAADHRVTIEEGRAGYIHGAAYISGDGALTLDGPGAFYMLGASTYTGGTNVLLGTMVVSGAGLIGSGSVTNNSWFDVYTPLSINGISGTGNTVIGNVGSGTNTSSTKYIRQNSLTINPGSRLNILQGAAANDPAGASKIQTLSLAGTVAAPQAALDLKNNALVIDYTGTSPIDDVRQLLKAGVDTAGTSGIVSSSGDAGKMLGYGEQTALGIASLAGQSMDADSIAIKYTYAGDADLNGKVNTIDFNQLAGAFGGSGVWTQGDFNYDGAVNSLDFTALAGNYGKSMPGAAPSLGGVVPEPTSLASVLIAATVLRRRCRR